MCICSRSIYHSTETLVSIAEHQLPISHPVFTSLFTEVGQLDAPPLLLLGLSKIVTNMTLFVSTFCLRLCTSNHLPESFIFQCTVLSPLNLTESRACKQDDQ